MNATEDDPLVSVGIYETSKTCQDLISQAYMKTYDLPVVIPRSCNAYGYDLARRIIPNTIRSCMRGDSPIVYEGEETKRQYIYVEDLCKALIHLMRSTPHYGVHNIATNDVLNQEEVVKAICHYFPLSPHYIKRENPILEIKSQSMKISEFGWEPKFSFSEGIQETIKKFERYGF